VIYLTMGLNKIDHAFPVALVLAKVADGSGRYQRVDTVAIDTRGINVHVTGSGTNAPPSNHFDDVGEIQIVTIV
jgi:hypothetical protein